MRLDIPGPAVAAIAKEYSSSDQGISIADFFRLLSSTRSGDAAPLTSAYKAILFELRRKFNGRSESELRDAFRRYEGQRRGFVSRRDFLSAMQQVNIALSQEERRMVFTAFDVDGLGSVDYEALLHTLKEAPAATPFGSPRSGIYQGAANYVRELFRITVHEQNVGVPRLFELLDRNKVGRVHQRDFRHVSAASLFSLALP